MSSNANEQTTITAGKKIRAGIVGAGLMGRWHADALEWIGGEVVGIADFDKAKAERLAAKYPNASVFVDVEEMLALQNLDVLHVCSPTASHRAIAEAAIKAGVHLLVEKPVAANAAETARLYASAAEHNTLLCPVHQFVFQNGVEKAKNLLPGIGQLVHLEANICSAGGTGFGPEQLDSIAEDILPHPLSLTQKFLDRGISDIDWSILRPADGELRIFGQAGEISLSIFISMNSRPTSNTFRLNGTNGTIHLDLFHGYSMIESGKTSRMTKLLHPFNLAVRSFVAAAANLSRRTLRREPAYPGLRRLIGEFYSAIRHKTEPPISPTEAIEIAEIRDLLIKRPE